MSHKSSFGPLCPQSDPGGQKASVPQLPACPCRLSILLEAPGCRSQQGELEKWPPCLPWKAWEGSSLRNLPPLVLLLTERTGVEQFVEQGYFFLYYPNPGLGRVYTLGGSFPLFWGFSLIIELEVITPAQQAFGRWLSLPLSLPQLEAPVLHRPCPFLSSARLTSQPWFTSSS